MCLLCLQWWCLVAPVLGLRDPLTESSYIGDSAATERLLDEWWQGHMSARAPITIDFRDEFNRTALMVCGMDPQTEDEERVDRDCGEIGRVLVKAGSNVHAVDNEGWTPVAYAAALG